MTQFTLDQTVPASFKGIGFLMDSGRVSGGPKNIKHEYPNSSRQTIQNIGTRPRSFTIRGVISGENYSAKKTALLAALDEGATGILVHPFFGEIPDMACMGYDLDETFGRLGEARISMSFDKDEEEALPQVAGTSLSVLNKARATTSTAIGNDISKSWNVSNSLIGVFESGRAKLEGFSTSFARSTRFIADASDTANSLTNLIGTFNQTIVSLVQTPDELSAALSNLYLTANATAGTARLAFGSMRDLFGFGDDDAESVQIDTFANRQKDSNDAVLNASAQAEALAYAYTSLSQAISESLAGEVEDQGLPLSTVAEIEDAEAVVEAQFRKVVTTEFISLDTRNALEDLRAIASDFITEQQRRARRVIAVETAQVPARVLVYNFYGSTENADLVIRVNPDQPDVSFVKGSYNVVTE